MTVAPFSGFIDELNYILARISRYQRNNQYVYLRAFESWQDAYNQIATQLKAQGTLRIPLFRLTPVDFSKSGKSITDACLARFIRTISRQVTRLEDKQAEWAEMDNGGAESRHPFRRFYLRDQAGNLCIPACGEDRVLVALPLAGAGQERFRLAIQPALEACALSFFLVDQAVTDERVLGEICRQLHACRLVIADLTGQDAHVMLVLGLAYGSGKPVIIVQEPGASTLGESSGPLLLCSPDKETLRTELTALLSQAPRSTPSAP